MAAKGKCIIFSAPSGAGKTTIVRALVNKPSLRLEFSVSACSREPRPNEVNGKDYYFLGIEGFKQQIEQDAFVEWEEVYTDHFYGTLRSEIEQIWENGHTVIFDVDVIGGLNLKRFFGANALAIFVQPPSYDELEKRLRYRSTETEEKIQQRMAKAKAELAKAVEFDVVLVNDTLEHAIDKATELVHNFIQAK
jgi:guanylate kinase